MMSSSRLLAAAGRTAVSAAARGPVRVGSSRFVSYVAAIDQGTSSTRVILYDVESAQPVASHQVPVTVITPEPGWAQMDPNEILSTVEQSAAGALAMVGATPADIAGIGITNQRETTVIWDRRTGEPLYDAVVWLDSRTRETVASLKHVFETPDHLCDQCGLPLSTYFSGVKLRWLLDNVPAVKAAVRSGDAMFGTVDSWLVWKLTGGATHATDFTNASRTMLMDIKTREWSTDCAAALGIESMMGALPEIRSCAESYGTITAAGSKTLAGVKITACIGDQQSAMAGQRCFREGMAKTTYGTGAFTLINTGTTPSPSKNGLLTTALFQLGPNEAPVYALEGAVAACAIGQDWFCDKLGMFPDAEEIHRLAGEVPAGAEGVFFVSAFGGLLAPRWRDDARGTLVGLTLAHDKSHVARAVVEGIAHQVREVTESMVQDSGVPLAAMRVDGGVARSAPLLQFQADLLNTKVERPHNIETTALGAALCAGVGAGVWTPADIADEAAAAEKSGQPVVEHVFSPSMGDAERASATHNWNKAVESSFNWAQ